MEALHEREKIESNKDEPDGCEGYPSIPIATEFQQELRLADPRVLPIKPFVIVTAIRNEIYYQIKIPS